MVGKVVELMIGGPPEVEGVDEILVEMQDVIFDVDDVCGGKQVAPEADAVQGSGGRIVGEEENLLDWVLGTSTKVEGIVIGRVVDAPCAAKGATAGSVAETECGVSGSAAIVRDVGVVKD